MQRSNAKISNVEWNARKREFIVQVGRESYPFPYGKLRLAPSSSDPVIDAYPDRELGKEAFTYVLKSGSEDTVHVDAVLEANGDPEYLGNLFLHQLSVEAKKGLDASGLGIRQLARQMRTSPAQLYRLLDPENRSKSVGQLMHLLHLLGRRVDLMVSEVND